MHFERQSYHPLTKTVADGVCNRHFFCRHLFSLKCQKGKAAPTRTIIPEYLLPTNTRGRRLTARYCRVVAQLRLHDGLVVRHLQESAGVRLQDDFAGLGQILMPVQHYVPERAEPRGRAHHTAAHARTDVSGEEGKRHAPPPIGARVHQLGESITPHPVDAYATASCSHSIFRAAAGSYHLSRRIPSAFEHPYPPGHGNKKKK